MAMMYSDMTRVDGHGVPKIVQTIEEVSPTMWYLTTFRGDSVRVHITYEHVDWFEEKGIEVAEYVEQLFLRKCPDGITPSMGRGEMWEIKSWQP